MFKNLITATLIATAPLNTAVNTYRQSYKWLNDTLGATREPSWTYSYVIPPPYEQAWARQVEDTWQPYHRSYETDLYKVEAVAFERQYKIKLQGVGNWQYKYSIYAVWKITSTSLIPSGKIEQVVENLNVEDYNYYFGEISSDYWAWWSTYEEDTTLINGIPYTPPEFWTNQTEELEIDEIETVSHEENLAYDQSIYMGLCLEQTIETNEDNKLYLSTENNPQFVFEYKQVEQSIEVIDVGGLLWDILAMPFAFISQAFNLTLFAGTPYAINVANTLFSVIAALVLIFIIKKLTH